MKIIAALLSMTLLCDQCSEEAPYCGDGFVNQDWEQCDSGGLDTPACTLWCREPTGEEMCVSLEDGKVYPCND